MVSVTGLGIHLRPLIRKDKSLLFGHISRIFEKTAVKAAESPLTPKTTIYRQFFYPFLAELDITEKWPKKNSNAKIKGFY